jgi:hypothetical protein
MCQDTPGQPPLRRIAVCACNQSFPECDLSDALCHITERSSPVHRWVYIAEEVRPLLGSVHGN